MVKLEIQLFYGCKKDQQGLQTPFPAITAKIVACLKCFISQLLIQEKCKAA